MTIYEKLKHNNIVFGELPENERDIFVKAGRQNCLVRGEYNWHIMLLTEKFVGSLTYCLKEDYQSEEEYEIEECEVVNVGNYLQYQRKGRTSQAITGVFSDPDFIAPLDKDGEIMFSLRSWDYRIGGRKLTSLKEPAEWPKKLLFGRKKK